MTRTSGSVPLGRSRTRPVSPSSSSAAGDGVLNDLVGARGRLVHSLDVDEGLGQARHDARQLGQSLAGALEAGGHAQGGEDSVSGGGVDGVDDVTGLLAAQS